MKRRQSIRVQPAIAVLCIRFKRTRQSSQSCLRAARRVRRQTQSHCTNLKIRNSVSPSATESKRPAICMPNNSQTRSTTTWDIQPLFKGWPRVVFFNTRKTAPRPPAACGVHRPSSRPAVERQRGDIPRSIESHVRTLPSRSEIGNTTSATITQTIAKSAAHPPDIKRCAFPERRRSTCLGAKFFRPRHRCSPQQI